MPDPDNAIREVHARGLDLAVMPGASAPERYAGRVDRTVVHDFTAEGNPTGICRLCELPRFRHRWVLFDGDTPVDCSEARPHRFG